MQETGQPLSNQLGQPMARPSAAPIQRGNYGIPTRQPIAPQPMSRPVAQPVMAVAPQPIAPAQIAPEPTPAMAPAPQPVVQPTSFAPTPMPAPSTPPPSSGQFMDFAPRPSQAAKPMLQTQAPVQAAPIVAPPIQPTIDPAPITAQRPLFTPSASATTEKPHHELPHVKIRSFKVLKFGLIGLAAILIIAGGAKFVSAGNTSKDTIAVGAVSANDGRSMTIQFTATDGKLHKYSTASNRDLIPGSAVEVAYRSGAPEATVRQVSIVKDGRNMGIMIALAGIACLAAGGIVAITARLKARGKHHGAPLTTALSV